MHHELKDSGLGAAFGISTVCSADDPRHQFLGKRVRLRPGLWKPSMGTIMRDHDFLIKEVQNNYAGQPRLRGYAVGTGDTFGRVIDPAEVFIVDDAGKE